MKIGTHIQYLEDKPQGVEVELKDFPEDFLQVLNVEYEKPYLIVWYLRA